MFKKALAIFILPFVFLLTPSDAGFANPAAQRPTSNAERPMLNSRQSQNGATGVLQKMIVESGTATMELDLNRLNAISVAPQKQEQMRFDLRSEEHTSELQSLTNLVC